VTSPPDNEPGRRFQAYAWRIDELTGLGLACWYVVLVAAVLALASVGGWPGVIAIMVISAGFVTWVTMSVGRRMGAGSRRP